MHRKCIVRGTVRARTVVFREMTNGRWGGFPSMGGKPGRYLGMEQILGCSSPPITARSPPTGDTGVPKIWNPMGATHGQLRSVTFQFLTFLWFLLHCKNIPGMKKTSLWVNCLEKMINMNDKYGEIKNRAEEGKVCRKCKFWGRGLGEAKNG